MNKEAFSVWQLNQYIKNIFEEDFILRNIWVQGEVSNLKKHSSGHYYFTLKDSKAAVGCVMFKTAASTLKFDLEDGMAVLIYGRVSLYEKTGQYQLYADMIEPSGKGALYLAYEQLKDKLYKEGLFDESHKKSIPKYPKVVGVITSETGAAVRDIIQISQRRNPNVQIVLIPVLVQGIMAGADIVRGIELANRWGKADVLIIGRGGGSIEDLWAFNEEKVARAVYNSALPVISAVGHEVDYTIIDFVSDMRAPTPSAAAELAVPDLCELNTQISSNKIRLSNAINSRFNAYEYKLKTIKRRMELKSPLQQIYQAQIHLEEVQKNMNKAINLKIQQSTDMLKHTIEKMNAVSPLAVLNRGYSIVYKNANMVKSIADVNENDIISIRFSDGTIKAKTIGKGE